MYNPKLHTNETPRYAKAWFDLKKAKITEGKECYLALVKCKLEYLGFITRSLKQLDKESVYWSKD